MELRNLRAFLAVVDTGSVSAAARTLHLAQPSVSEQIARLEREVGRALFLRLGGPRGLQLTDAGRALVEPVRELLDRAERLPQQAARAAPLQRLRLGVPVGFDALLLERLIGGLATGAADGVAPVPSSTAQTVDGLRDGRLEAGIIRLPVMDAELEVVPLLTETLGLWLPAGHPLLGLPEVPAERLDGVPLSVFPRAAAPGAWEDIAETLRSLGAYPQWVELPASDSGLPVRLYSEAAHLSTQASTPAKAGLSWAPLAGDPLHLRSALARRADAAEWVVLAGRAGSLALTGAIGTSAGRQPA